MRILILLILCQACVAQDVPSCSKILRYAEQQLPHSGELSQSGKFVYVDVDDAYIHELIAFIRDEGFEEPPYFVNSDSAGAHITVIYPEEMKTFGIGTIEECGEMIAFTPKRCEVVHPPRWEIGEVYVIVVEAPALDRIREKYGLPKREHPFHITVGVRPRAVDAA